LFIPKHNDRFRLVVVAGFFALHLGFALCLHLGVFPYLCMASWTLLLPGSFWRALEARGQRWAAELPRWRPARSVPVRWASGAAIPFRRFATRGGFALSAMVLVLLINVKTFSPRFPLPKPVAQLAIALGLQQFWAVFAPRGTSGAAMSDGWFVFPAKEAGGKEVDALAEDEVLRYEKPERVSATLKNHRWRHYFANLSMRQPEGSPAEDTLEKSRQALLSMLCRRWNASHDPGSRISEVEMVYLDQLLGFRNGPIKRRSLGKRSCD
jgi:hypothetical protein